MSLVINCRGVSTEESFWETYLVEAKAEGASDFGKNLDAFWDALTGGGPGFTNESIIKFVNTEELPPKLKEGLIKISEELELLEYETTKITISE